MTMRPFLAMLLLPCAAFCQQAAPAQNMTDQDATALFNRISRRAARIQPMLDQLHTKDWIAKGAPDTYLAQWNSTVEQFQAIQSDMSSLAQQPGHMTESMKALFRLQAAHQVLGSLLGGARKYQNPALADLIESVAAEASADIEHLEQYVLELADEKERQYTVVDREAQRCRATLSRQPASPATTVRRPQ